MLTARLATAAAVALAVAIAPAAAAPGKKRKGKVVRVERSGDRSGGLRICLTPGSDGTVICYGRAPRVGEVATIVDTTGVRGTVEVTSVSEGRDTCGSVNSWPVTTRVTSGSPRQLSYDGSAMLFDYPTTVRTRAVDGSAAPQLPANRPEEYYMGAVDDDGDGTADVVQSWFPCDGSGQFAQGGGRTAYCLAYYRRRGSQFEPLRVDVVPNCYP
jgi:hypothetical protein